VHRVLSHEKNTMIFVGGGGFFLLFFLLLVCVRSPRFHEHSTTEGIKLERRVKLTSTIIGIIFLSFSATYLVGVGVGLS
jgi:heme/copper-type cytochrome/quinol oxidase subunit 2